MIMKQTDDKNGYKTVGLVDDNGKQKLVKVHRIVYTTWISDIPKGMHVNHINENKHDNSVSNLNLMNPKDNNNHGTRNHRIARSLFNGKKSVPVTATNIETGEVFEFSSMAELGRSGIACVASACNVANGKRNSVNGYVINKKKEQV